MTVAPQLVSQLTKNRYSPAVAFCPPTMRGSGSMCADVGVEMQLAANENSSAAVLENLDCLVFVVLVML